jgi:hypothetical protein
MKEIWLVGLGIEFSAICWTEQILIFLADDRRQHPLSKYLDLKRNPHSPLTVTLN